MTRTRKRSALVIGVLLVSVAAAALHAASPASPATTPDTLADLAFMAGCWRGPSRGGGVIEEYYSAPSSNLIVGATRYLRDGRAVDFEFTTIERDSAGIVLRPRPKGTPSVAFKLASLERGAAAWENRQHDFPQRISYRSAAPDSLVARIEGPSSGGTPAIEWRMRRVPCDAT